MSNIVKLMDTTVPGWAWILFHGNEWMQKQTRTAKILVSLVASMSLGALILIALDNQTISAGPFSLASYVRLNPVEEVTSTLSIPNAHNWNRIYVHYSSASAANLEQLAAVNDLANPKELNFHFAVFNGIDSTDGKIHATEKWLKQSPALPEKNWLGSSQAIRICVIADGIRALPTDCQVKRTAALIESLARKFNIQTAEIHYPTNWQL